jgi:hypothetical protein
MLNPDGEPIVNPIIEHLFKDRLGKMGLDAGEFEKEVFEGEIKVDVMAPFDVLLDDSAQVFEDCKYAFCVHPMSSDEIYARYNVRLKPNAINRYPDETLPGMFGTTSGKTKQNVRTVYVGYFFRVQSFLRVGMLRLLSRLILFCMMVLGLIRLRNFLLLSFRVCVFRVSCMIRVLLSRLFRCRRNLIVRLVRWLSIRILR